MIGKAILEGVAMFGTSFVKSSGGVEMETDGGERWTYMMICLVGPWIIECFVNSLRCCVCFAVLLEVRVVS